MIQTRKIPTAAGRAWRWKWRILAGLVFVGLTVLAASLSISRGQPGPVAPAAEGPRAVVAQAAVVPLQSRQLAFQTSGLVHEVSVKVGDSVKAGTVLATLDTSELKLQVEAAEAGLALQQATIEQGAEKPADPEIAAAQANLESALARQKQVESGAAATDLKAAEEGVASAQAALTGAQAQLAKVKEGPAPNDLAAAEAALKSAEAQVAAATQRQAAVKARPRPEDLNAAQLAVEQAKNSLWATQISRDATCGAAGSASAPCKSADANVAAQETALKTAQANLSKASEAATAEELKAAEDDVRSAEAARTSAQAQLAKVQAGATVAEWAAAQSQVDQAAANLRSAQAKLDQLKAGSTVAELESARSAVEQARASLDKLTTGPSSATIRVGQARLEQARITLSQAELALKNAVIRAPFDGVVTSISLKAGDVAGPATPAMTLADLSRLDFETKDLDEIGAAEVFVGQAAKVTVPALDKRVLDGTVTALSAEPSFSSSGDVSYTARITLKEPPPELRWGQTARVEFAAK